MRNIPTTKIFTQKRKDQQVKERRIKYDAMCPHFSYYSPCINLIGKDWCPFQHIVDVRKAAQRQEEYFQNGEEPDEEVLHNIATQNAVT